MMEVRSRAFAGLWSLRVLVLSDSGIQLLQPEAFYSLSFLEKLDMSRNKLLWLPPDFSHSLSSVRELRLDHSTLERLEVSSLEHLEKLDLSHNHITFLQPGAFRGLPRLRPLQLAGNPWNCDCDLHRVFSKLLSVRHLHVDDYHNVTCHEPLQLAGASLAWVDSQLCMAEMATVLVITVTVLVTVLAAVVMAEHTRKKNQHAKSWDAESQSQER
ncbi:leucine-rich repeat-containing protein 26-like [Oncorhynchus nerka]|uniref:leucine-rich repeat-containing protein 26-like n=1 Tax=Oncorhynchus nerka TaxID=8023 RepID=UPI0011314DC0|nr:leucine-rich repeat-containing protein 26-like [Oncorhynchus nerka]